MHGTCIEGTRYIEWDLGDHLEHNKAFYAINILTKFTLGDVDASFDAL